MNCLKTPDTVTGSFRNIGKRSPRIGPRVDYCPQHLLTTLPDQPDQTPLQAVRPPQEQGKDYGEKPGYELN